MSGHSKFANIKHKKEKNDAKKGKIFTIIGREIVMAVKAGGPDPNNNGKLRDVIAKAKANNMPNDTIDRGIKKAAGDVGNVNYKYVTYEGYGPNGIAIIVWMYMGYECMSNMAGEMTNPQIIPKAMRISQPIIALSYILPTLGALAAIGSWSSWSTEQGGGAVGYADVLIQHVGSWAALRSARG